MLVLCVGVLSRTIAAQEKPAAKPVVGKTKPSSADEELLKDLVPDIPLGGSDDESSDGSSGLDELEKTITAMRKVGKRLDDGDTSDETRALQAGILDDIDALIEKLKTQPPPQQNPNQKPPQDQSQNDQEKPQQSESQSKPKTQPKPSTGKQPTGSGAGQKQENKTAGESTEENLKQARARATNLARRRALIDEFWGHLPAALRERLLNVGSEKVLPQYEELIRRYNESLADSPDAQKR
jgi:hypothetical protein